MKFKTKIIKISNVTHDVKSFLVEKPLNYKYIPGQATYVSINQGSWKYEERPFTFTSLNKEPNPEFVIKRYTKHNGVTKRLHELKRGR